jgi:DNA-binding transcriptional ArsR family regulator
MSNLLINEYPLLVLPSLAVKIGLGPAIVLQQIQYWSTRVKRSQDGYFWVYNTIEEWGKQFPFWHQNTIATHLKKLRDAGILVAEFRAESALNRTLFYRIDYTKLDELIPQKLGNEFHQNCEIPIYTETTKDRKAALKPPPLEIPDWLDKTDWEDFIAMRKKIGKPMTDRAVKILINKLAKMKSKGVDFSASIQNSILNNWSDVYEPKFQEVQATLARRVK